MSKRYPGGLITKTPVTPTPSSAPGIWTLEQQLQAQQAGTWPFGGPFNYIEDVFSTYLYTGNGPSSQNITNNINMSGYGGLVWVKNRSTSSAHALNYGQVSGPSGLFVSSDRTTGNSGANNFLFRSDGFSVGNEASTNSTGSMFCSWTFRKQPKFFDVVTYTGTGSNSTVSHNLGSVPGCIIVKRTDTTSNWRVYHRELDPLASLILNSTAAADYPNSTIWNGTAPTGTVFSVGTSTDTNASGGTYVAYLFAHNAGGFGLTGSDNVISCGSFTTDGSGNATVNLGYEPQWILYKNITSAENWFVRDVLRGWSKTTNSFLLPNTSSSETFTSGDYTSPNATGFQMGPVAGAVSASSTYIYIAIRRGPMKVPTVGTSVFQPLAYTGNGGINTLTSNFAPDVSISSDRSGTFGVGSFLDKLRGYSSEMQTWTTNSESTYTSTAATNITAYRNTGVTLGSSNDGAINASGTNYATYLFGRAPGFFDEVCYTGDGTSALAVTHNLQAVPQLIITKQRDAVRRWQVYSVTTGASAYLVLNTTAASFASSSMWNATTPTSTTFTVGDIGDNNVSGGTYVAYLFATCPGVSKVGSYSGTGATQTIDCGFTGGARFVLIKRTDSTGGWYVWDTARGMVAGTDPSLFLNSFAAEVNANSVYTTSVGFQIVSTAAGINASGGTYIFLAVA